MFLSQHLVSSSRNDRPRRLFGARCVGYDAEMMWSAAMFSISFQSLCTYKNENITRKPEYEYLLRRESSGEKTRKPKQCDTPKVSSLSFGIIRLLLFHSDNGNDVLEPASGIVIQE